MIKTVKKALALWGWTGAKWDLVAARENSVCRIDVGDHFFALRLHRKGFRTDTELWSELIWMAHLREHGLPVPRPIPNLSGAVLEVIDGIQVDAMSWLPGPPVGQTGRPLDVPDRNGLFAKIGHEMARLHVISDAWEPPRGFQRWAWDKDGFLGEAPLWGRFWENPTLSRSDRALFRAVREKAADDLAKSTACQDFGLIHADLVRENILRDGEAIYMIDFDDGGYGYRLFDLATALFKNMQEPDFPALKSAMVQGYQNQRALDTSNLDLFVLLRALTYIGWIVPRLQEKEARSRNKRFINAARPLAEAYLRRE